MLAALSFLPQRQNEITNLLPHLDTCLHNVGPIKCNEDQQVSVEMPLFLCVYNSIAAPPGKDVWAMVQLAMTGDDGVDSSWRVFVETSEALTLI